MAPTSFSPAQQITLVLLQTLIGWHFAYEGYVKLAERIYRMRDNAEVPPGSLAEREWEARVRRVTDGIERTTARLDLLEEYNPELATDDRISRRAGIARSHAELERSRR
jgi:hypothetical protein